MMGNLRWWRIVVTNYFKQRKAWRDWKRVAQQAHDAGKDELVEWYHPPPGSHWRTIDKRRHMLETQLKAQEKSTDE